VDEGQDFRGGWWRALEAVMAPGAVLYVFYDENQAIFGPPEGMPIATPPFTLTRNCRQTAALNEWVARLCDGEVHPKDDAPPGVPPEIRRYRSEDELHRHVEEVLEHWIGREHLAPGDVAVLTPHGRACRVWRRRAYGPWRLTEEWPAPGGQVAWATVHRFKGLEASGVILAEIEPDVPGGLARVLYVGASRARHRLAIVASAEVDLERARGVSAVGAQAPPAPLR
jgi:superfamily I DNA/RNA helicase